MTGIDFGVKEGERRAGDPPMLYADPSKIAIVLDQAEEKGLYEGGNCSDRSSEKTPTGCTGSST